MELVRLAIGAVQRALSYWVFFPFPFLFFFLETQSNPFITHVHILWGFFFLRRERKKKPQQKVAGSCTTRRVALAFGHFPHNKEHQQPVAQERQSQISLLGTRRPHEVRTIRQSNEITAPERVYYMYYHIDFAGLLAHSAYKCQT